MMKKKKKTLDLYRPLVSSAEGQPMCLPFYFRHGGYKWLMPQY